jgi:hypothetical protein
MTRCEDLSLKFADGVISEEELAELEALVARDPQAAQACFVLLDLEGVFRGCRANLDLSEPSMQRIHRMLSNAKIENGVMQAIRRGKRNSPARMPGRTSGSRKVFWWPLAACGVLAAALLIWLAIPSTEVLKPVGRVVYVQDQSVSAGPRPMLVRGSGANEKSEPLVQDMLLRTGDCIRTPSRSEASDADAVSALASVVLDNGATIDLAQETNLRLLAAERMELNAGHIYAVIGELDKPLHIQTPLAEVESSAVRFDLSADKTHSDLLVEAGSATFVNSFGRIKVGSMQRSTVTVAAAPNTPATIMASALWRGRKQRAPAPPAPPALPPEITATTQPNLLENPGFEGGEQNWYGPVISASGKHSVVGTPVHSGTKALQINFDESEYGVGQDVPVSAKATYNISAWVKMDVSNPNASARLCIGFRELNKKEVTWVNVGEVKGTRDWIKLSGRVSAPKNAVKATVFVQASKLANTSGTIWTDDFEMLEASR